MGQKCNACKLDKKILKQFEQDYVDGMNVHQLHKKYGLSYQSTQFHIQSHHPEKIIPESQ